MIKKRLLELFRNYFSVILIVCIIFNPLIADEKPIKRTSGISASFQETQLDINIPFWIKNKFVIAPAISALYVEDGGTDLGIGATIKFYISKKKVTPYLGARIGAFILTPKGGDTVSDFLFGLLYGGEYFISPKFSIGIEAQVNLFKSHDNSARFGNPGGVNINTGTAVIANIYF